MLFITLLNESPRKDELEPSNPDKGEVPLGPKYMGSSEVHPAELPDVSSVPKPKEETVLPPRPQECCKVKVQVWLEVPR